MPLVAAEVPSGSAVTVQLGTGVRRRVGVRRGDPMESAGRHGFPLPRPHQTGGFLTPAGVESGTGGEEREQRAGRGLVCVAGRAELYGDGEPEAADRAGQTDDGLSPAASARRYLALLRELVLRHSASPELSVPYVI